MPDSLRLLFQYLLPHHLLSHLMYLSTRIRAPWFKNRQLRWFVGKYPVNMSEAVESEPTNYEHFNAFFTRALRPECRPHTSGINDILCPVDGAVSQLGPIDGDQVFQAKGHSYSLQALVGGSPEHAAQFRDGQFATLYLAPHDYHRIHMPISGTLREMIHVPGELFSVAPLTVQGVPGLFARNERLVCLFDTAVGPLAVILVGAMFVASMETVWAGTVTPPTGNKNIRRWTYENQIVTLERGEELGRFNMGSTVILLFGKDHAEWSSDLVADKVTRMGEKIGVTRV